MKSLPQLLRVFGVLLAGVTLLGQGISLSSPPDTPDTLSAIARQILHEASRRQVLDRRSQLIEEASAAKRGITHELIAERLSLKEAMRAFSEIDRSSLAQTNALQGNEYLLLEQKVFERVIDSVQGELHSRPCQAYEVVQHLQEQRQALQAAKRKSGSFR